MKIKKLNEAIEPQNTMKIMPLSGLNADGFTVIVLDSEGNELFNKEYRYGVNSSYDRRFAKWAEEDCINAKKYGWKTPRAPKPYVADIVDELCKKYAVDKNSVEFVPGKNTFSGGNVTDDFVSRMKQRVYESNSTTSKKGKLAEGINDPDEVLDFRRSIEAAESAEEIEELIISLSDGVAEDVIRTEFNLHKDADLEEIKDAVLCELDLYLDDNTWLGESKKMKKLGSGGKKLNESSYDGPYGAYDVKRLVSGRGPQDWWVLKEIEMDFGDGAKVASYLKKKGIKVEFNADDATWFVRGQYHFTDCYFYPYAYGHEDEESLTEGARPSQSTLDDCLEYYLNNAFGYDGVEDYVDTEFPHHDNAFKAEVVNYIKERKHLDEDATQYGVHQFSTDSIIFRGTEQECGEYIDNNQKLWDDAEVYRMEPGDPHYKKMTEALSGYKLNITKGSKTFDDYCYAYSEDEAKRQMSNKYGEDATINGVEVRSKAIKEASYGGAYDIEDDQYFTRDDLNSFGEEVLAHISETFNGKYDVGGVWFENGNVITQIVDDIGNEFEDTTKVDMRRIREPQHLRRMYGFPVAANIIQKIKENDSDVISENVQGEGKYSDIFHKYLEWLLDEGKEDNIGYLASQLIRYCPEEDLKDLWHDRMEKVAGTVGYNTGSSLEEGTKETVRTQLQTLLDKKGLTLNPDYGTIGDAVEYILTGGQSITPEEWIKETQNNYPEYFKEALTEDLEVPTLEGPKEGPESGLASMLNEAIQEELKTVQMYNDLAITARAEGFEEIAGQIDEINTEENKHIGQLQEVLKTVAPNAQAIDAGELEAGDTIINVEQDTNNSNNTPNNNIEEDVSMKKERWEDIYNSFKAVEKELNQDGEAVTAVVDKMYQDNKDDPDYKKAYDKWASGE